MLVVILVFNLEMKQALNSCGIKWASLTSSDVSVEDSAKGAVNVASSVQESL